MTTESRINRIIIPAAGYGRRVGSPPAKELFPGPEDGEPLIKWSLDLARSLGISPLVITRHDKIELNTYLTELKTVDLYKIDNSIEWQDSILQAYQCWGEKNILILPDTRFNPIEAVSKMFDALNNGVEFCAALFDVHDLTQWGVIAEIDNSFWLADKPKRVPPTAVSLAWGLLGFNRTVGIRLLSDQLQNRFNSTWSEIPSRSWFMRLNSFLDLTR